MSISLLIPINVIPIMKNLFVYLFNFILVFGAYAQGFGVAVFIKETKSKPIQEITDELSRELVNSCGKDILIYNWNEDGIKINNVFSKEESPSIFTIFINTTFKTSNNLDKPNMFIGVDSTGMINSASLTLEYSVDFDINMIDVSTDEIVGLETVSFNVYDNFENENNPSDKLKISINNGQKKSKIKINAKKYFGQNNLKSLKKNIVEYNKIKSRIYKDYKSSIDNFNQKSLESFINRTPYLVSIISNLKNNFISPLIVFDGESISDLNPELVKNLSELDLLKVYGERKLNNRTYVDYISEFRLNFKENKVFKKIDFNKTIDLNDYTKFFVVKTESINNSNSNEKGQFLNLGISNNKMANSLKTKIINCPGIKLIDRHLQSELNYLRQLFSYSRFDNLDFSENINTRIGIDYFASFSSGNVNFLSVETGEQLRINKKGIYCGTNIKGYWNIQSFNAGVLKISGAKIEFVSIAKIKKDKVKEIEIFNPLGFNKQERIYIFSLNKEVVNGVKYLRKEKIGHGLVDRKPDSNQNAILTVYKGKKKLFNALENKEKLAFTYDSAEMF